MKNYFLISVIFTFLTLVGFYSAYLYGRKIKKFRWSEYVSIMIVPLICVAFLTYLDGYNILLLFVISCFVGFGLEYTLGVAYHKTLNKRLWTYNISSLGGYTSFQSIPFWGIAGIVFYLIAKAIGL